MGCNWQVSGLCNKCCDTQKMPSEHVPPVFRNALFDKKSYTVNCTFMNETITVYLLLASICLNRQWNIVLWFSLLLLSFLYSYIIMRYFVSYFIDTAVLLYAIQFFCLFFLLFWGGGVEKARHLSLISSDFDLSHLDRVKDNSDRAKDINKFWN